MPTLLWLSDTVCPPSWARPWVRPWGWEQGWPMLRDTQAPLPAGQSPSTHSPCTHLPLFSPSWGWGGRGGQKGHLAGGQYTRWEQRKTLLRFQVPRRAARTGLGEGWVLGESGIGGSGSRPLLYLIGTAKRLFSERLVGAEIPTDSKASVKSGRGDGMLQGTWKSVCPRPRTRTRDDGVTGASCKRDGARGKPKG